MLEINEIAARLHKHPNMVSEACIRDVQLLKGIITDLRKGEVDFDAFRARGVKNVLSVLHFLRQPVPPLARLPELRELADCRMRQTLSEDRLYQVLSMGFGTIPSGARMTHKEIADIMGLSKSYIRDLEYKGVEELKAVGHTSPMQA